MRKIKIFIAIFLVGCTAIAQAQHTWTLQQCIDTALANNRNIKQQKITYQSKQIDLAQSKANRLPDLNASLGQNLNFGRSLGVDNTYQQTNSSNTSFSISSGLTLFDGFRMKNEIEAKQAELLAAGANVRKVEEDIIMNVTTVYLQVLQNKELLQNSLNQLTMTQENIQRRAELIKAGKMAEGEIYELQAQQSKEELTRVEAENNLQLSILNLAQVLELNDFNNIDVIAPNDLLINELTLLSADEVYKNTLSNRPELAVVRYRLESNKKNIEIAKAGYMPSVRLGVNLGTGYYNMSNVSKNASFANQFKNNMSSGVGVTLSIPIFNRFQVKNQIANAELMVENTLLEIEKTKIELHKIVQQAYYNALAAKKRWLSAQHSIKANEESYRFANQKFEVGKANQYEVNLAKNNLAQSILEETQAKYEYFFRIKILEFYRN